MTDTNIDLDKSVSNVINNAATYITNNRSRLSLNDGEVAALQSYLKNEAKNDSTLTAKIKTALQDGISSTIDTETQDIKTGKGFETVLVAGGFGSYGLLNDGNKITEVSPNSIVSDFQKFKKTFGLESASSQEYDKMRPILSGIDVELGNIARDTQNAIIRDSSLSFAKAQHNDGEKRLTDLEKQGKVSIIAMALSPDEAANISTNSNQKVAAEESAKNFASFFQEKLTKHSEIDITLFNKDGEKIYERQNGKITQLDEKKFSEWYKENGLVINTEKSTHGLDSAGLSKNKNNRGR